MKDPSYRFLASKWFVHNCFVNLSNPFDVVVHYLFIRGMIYLDYQDRVLMVSTLVWWVIIYNVRLLGSHNSLSCYIVLSSQPWEDTELVPKSIIVWPMGEILKWLYIPYRLVTVDRSQ